MLAQAFRIAVSIGQVSPQALVESSWMCFCRRWQRVQRLFVYELNDAMNSCLENLIKHDKKYHTRGVSKSSKYLLDVHIESLNVTNLYTDIGSCVILSDICTKQIKRWPVAGKICMCMYCCYSFHLTSDHDNP